MSVQVHAELVQLLAGNARGRQDARPRAARDCLTLAHALMAREGLPVTLLVRRRLGALATR